MKPTGLEEIASAVGGRWLRPPRSDAAIGVTIDTRAAGSGELFIAIRGRRLDGHDFLSQAQSAGCAAAVVARDASQPTGLATGPMGLLQVGDTTRALADLASHCRDRMASRVLAVTGSNGKTTVKRMIHHILSKRLAGSASPKSFNNEFGVPLTILDVSPGDDYVVCEIGTNAPGEIETLGRIARPDVAVITSVGPSHLAGFGSVERVAIEKASLLGCLEPDGVGLVWADSEALNRAAAAHSVRMIGFGTRDAADLRLTGREITDRGQWFQVNGRLWVELSPPGTHNALNALAAIGAACRFGLSQDDAAAALADFSGVEMRLETLRAGGVTILNDAYNANPASVTAALEALAETGAGRKVAVLGDMRELGDREIELHEQTGRAIAGAGIDLLIGVGALGRYFVQGASGSRLETATFESVDAAREELADLLADGDVVLVKGSRALRMERLVEVVRSAFAAARPAHPARTRGLPT